MAKTSKCYYCFFHQNFSKNCPDKVETFRMHISPRHLESFVLPSVINAERKKQ